MKDDLIKHTDRRAGEVGTGGKAQKTQKVNAKGAATRNQGKNPGWVEGKKKRDEGERKWVGGAEKHTKQKKGV